MLSTGESAGGGENDPNPDPETSGDPEEPPTDDNIDGSGERPGGTYIELIHHNCGLYTNSFSMSVFMYTRTPKLLMHCFQA